MFPILSRVGTLAITEKQLGNSSIVIMNPDGSNRRVVFDVEGKGLDPVLVKKGLAGAFQPGWSPDSQWIAFGIGSWFQERVHGKATLMRVRRDGTNWEPRTDGTVHSGFPSYSPDGSRIVFTRKVDAVNFDIFTIRPDGTDLRRLTTHGANDGHAVWSADGRILWSSGMYGFRDEAALYDNTFQPDGQIFVMNADGSGKRIITDSLWEDSMPLYLPARAP